jgi:hypothetical protein
MSEGDLILYIVVATGNHRRGLDPDPPRRHRGQARDLDRRSWALVAVVAFVALNVFGLVVMASNQPSENRR